MAYNTDKIIVSNRSVLMKKYKESGLEQIEAAVRKLIQADARKGIASRFFYLDDKMIRRFRATPVRQVESGHQNKNAMDALYRWFKPDYILILGSSDVVPHIKVSNLTGDEDGLIIDSDLPYSCDRPFHRNARHFLSPTRVLGRLPDIHGGRNPAYLVRLLENATTITKRPRKDYEAWFGLSAKVWTGSSAITSANLFSNFDGLSFCPPEGTGKHRHLDKARIHFFNCHGDSQAHKFWGQQEGVYPTSFSSDDVPPQLLEGTFVAAECCYGAQQYAPGRGKLSISATYLFSNAAAYVGSTTIAYGEDRSQENADLLTQYFVQFVLRGHSIGRAFLEAQQEFIKSSAPRIDIYELKTIAQFLLLGDPSIHLVQRKHKSLVVDRGKLLIESQSAEKFFRKARRQQLQDNGIRAGRSVKTPRAEGRKVPKERHRQFSKLARQNGLRRFTTSMFSYGSGKGEREKHYVYLEKRSSIKGALRRPSAIVFKENNGQIDVRVYEPK
jgi:hypothetical protein